MYYCVIATAKHCSPKMGSFHRKMDSIRMIRNTKTEGSTLLFSTLFFCFHFFDMVLASKGSSFRTYFIFTAADVLPCGGRKTSPRKLSQCR